MTALRCQSPIAVVTIGVLCVSCWLAPLARMPVDLLIRTIGCDGVPNAWYQRQGKLPTVSICYEYLQEIWQSVPVEAKTPMGATFHATFWPHLDHEKVKKVLAMNWFVDASG